MVPDSSLTQLWPTPQGGNLSIYYDITSVPNDDGMDSLWGTLEIITRATQAN